MCTRNGELFLTEQLKSLVAQDRPPDELVVIDDSSDDGSVGIVEDFASSAHFPVVVRVHEECAGITASFEEAIEAATGDIIMPCDQDDVWMPTKISRLAGLLEERPELAAAFCDSLVVDEVGRDLRTTHWSELHFSPREREMFASGKASEVLLRHPVVAGHTLALRATWRRVVLPISRNATYDSWIARVLVLAGSVAVVDEVLVKYRQHSQNAIGVRRHSALPCTPAGHRTREDIAREGRAWREALVRLEDTHPRSLDETVRALLQARIAHSELRGGLPSRRIVRIPSIARELMSGRYRTFSQGSRTALADLLWHR